MILRFWKFNLCLQMTVLYLLNLCVTPTRSAKQYIRVVVDQQIKFGLFFHKMQKLSTPIFKILIL
jgi:hypothetical protein